MVDATHANAKATVILVLEKGHAQASQAPLSLQQQKPHFMPHFMLTSRELIGKLIKN